MKESIESIVKELEDKNGQARTAMRGIETAHDNIWEKPPRSVETRIEGTDTMPTVIIKMSGGNPEAMRVCMDILEHGEEIDPDAAMGGFAALLSLDSHGIYEHRIWMLYKDVCGEDLPTMLAINRACQLGIIDRGTLDTAIDGYGRGLNVLEVVRQVKDRLPAFNVETS